MINDLKTIGLLFNPSTVMMRLISYRPLLKGKLPEIVAIFNLICASFTQPKLDYHIFATNQLMLQKIFSFSFELTLDEENAMADILEESNRVLAEDFPHGINGLGVKANLNAAVNKTEYQFLLASNEWQKYVDEFMKELIGKSKEMLTNNKLGLSDNPENKPSEN